MPDKLLGLGKLSRDELDRLVFKYLPMQERVDLDGALLDLRGRTVVAHSPSIGVPLDALGFFAFHYSSGNVAVKFGIPSHMIVGIYLPLETRESDLRLISRTLGEEAEKYGVKIIAGQTATYYGIEAPLLTSTCLGYQTREPERPVVGDIIAVIGEIGGESLWLNSIKEGDPNPEWRSFTLLPIALELQEVDGVKIMHDVSERGIVGALKEVSAELGLRIDLEPDRLNYTEGVESMGRDVLKVPTYGSLIAVFKPDSMSLVKKLCSDMNRPLSILGRLKDGSGMHIEGRRVRDVKRSQIDEIYGKLGTEDEVTRKLSSVLDELEDIPDLHTLIPEVGTNLAYAKSYADIPRDVAALNGRIIKAKDKVLLCGEVTYGGSEHLASVLLAATKIDPSRRAAANIRLDEEILRSMEKLNLNIIRIPSRVDGGICPVTNYIERVGVLADVYVHPGAFGIEPSVTLLAKEPEELLEVIREIIKHDCHDSSL